MRKMDLFHWAIHPLWVLTLRADLIAAPALLLLAVLAKPKPSCERAREAFTWHMLCLQLCHLQLLGNLQLKGFFNRKDLYQAAFLYLFFKEAFVKKGFPDPS